MCNGGPDILCGGLHGVPDDGLGEHGARCGALPPPPILEHVPYQGQEGADLQPDIQGHVSPGPGQVRGGHVHLAPLQVLLLRQVQGVRDHLLRQPHRHPLHCPGGHAAVRRHQLPLQQQQPVGQHGFPYRAAGRGPQHSRGAALPHDGQVGHRLYQRLRHLPLPGARHGLHRMAGRRHGRRPQRHMCLLLQHGRPVGGQGSRK
mmetsp:Transcript_26345/g.65516  ORF Transcript_26345/g.65516 Transcript_26345/m.65516 type:complete len:203 (+) Transcript_26345:83-691(+)